MFGCGADAMIDSCVIDCVVDAMTEYCVFSCSADETAISFVFACSADITVGSFAFDCDADAASNGGLVDAGMVGAETTNAVLVGVDVTELIVDEVMIPRTAASFTVLNVGTTEVDVITL